MIPKALKKNKYQLRNDDFFKGYSKWPIWPKMQRGDPLQNSQNRPFFWLNFGSFKKQEILVRFQPNWYGWTRNLFQFLTIPKSLKNIEYQLRNGHFSKGYSKWPILAKSAKGGPFAKFSKSADFLAELRKLQKIGNTCRILA